MRPPASLAARLLAAAALCASLWPAAARCGPEQPAAPAPAVEAAPPPEAVERAPWKTVLLFAGGAASAFALHESGHALAGAALGGWPHLEKVTFLGFIPFFAVAPGLDCYADQCTKFGEPFPPGRRGAYLIVSAGFHVQHLTDELLLSLEPDLRAQDAPFRKGMLAFNTLTSIGYVLANWLSIEPRAGDVGAVSRLTPIPRGLYTGLLLSAAGLDLGRYFAPDVTWLRWASRAVKLGTLGLIVTF